MLLVAWFVFFLYNNSKLQLTKVPGHNHQLATASATLLTVAFPDMSTFAKFQFCCSTIITFTFEPKPSLSASISTKYHVTFIFPLPIIQ